MQGYAYILTHPGTPAVFYDHLFSHYQPEISALISVRNRKKVSCRSTVSSFSDNISVLFCIFFLTESPKSFLTFLQVKIVKADRDVYAAVIDDKVAMKIGPGHYEPQSGPQRWSVAVEGNDYKVWEAL